MYPAWYTYYEVRHFKKSFVTAMHDQLNQGKDSLEPNVGLGQVIVENFDTDLSSTNGRISTHEMAILEMHSFSTNNARADTIPRIEELPLR